PRAWLLAHPDTMIAAGELKILNSYLQKLVDGCPFAYITGEREFFGRKFAIQPGILVPRPETELLVETALQWLAGHPSHRAVVDVGCGSGCIAISLAAECPGITICAVDIFPDAVRLTQRNAGMHQVNSNVLCLVGDLIATFNTKFDMICANLPYIPTRLLNGLAVTRFEPALALDGGENGLQIIDRLLKQAVRLISPGGLILLEIESAQGESAQQLALQYFPQSEVRLVRDLADHPRLVIIQT
ncbi:MAG: peptide chain release factor N(5)-glutamine methyltransferase, partial [Leptolinea sp.]